MKKIILLLFLMSIPFAQNLESGKAYIVSSINVNSTGQIESGKSYSLVPQIVVATGSENYAGSVTPFTGCYGGKRYEKGSETGNCLTGVVNSLNSDSTTDALSAAQGKVLNDRTRINYVNKILPSQTLNGIDLTNNGDGTYTVNGTNTSNEETVFWLENVFIPKGTYKVVGAPNSPYVSIGGDYEPYATYLGKIVTKDTDGYYGIGLVIQPNSTVSNFVFKPMVTNDLEATYEDFVPYQDSLATNQTIIDVTRVNLFRSNINWDTYEKNGITITNNHDGTFTANGVADNNAFWTDDSYVDIRIGKIWIDKGTTYKVIGSPDNEGVFLGGDIIGSSGYKGSIKTAQESRYYDLDIGIYKGSVLDNVIFKPMVTTDLNATYDDFISFNNSLLTGSGGEMQVVLLWENANPNSVFDYQTVKLNAKEYSYFYITFKRRSTDNASTNVNILLRKWDSQHICTEYETKIIYRELPYSGDDGITFGNASAILSYSTGTAGDNNLLVPIRIFGIK